MHTREKKVAPESGDYNPQMAYKTNFNAINHSFRAYIFKVNYSAQVHRLVSK